MQAARVQLRLLLPDGRSFGPGKAELLTRIDELGSIAAAGRAMKMSYKRAWGLVEEMNASFRTVLVTTERGGVAHGGARLTDLGRAVLARYRGLVVWVEGADDLDFIASVLAGGQDGLPLTVTSVMSGET